MVTLYPWTMPHSSSSSDAIHNEVHMSTGWQVALLHSTKEFL